MDEMRYMRLYGAKRKVYIPFNPKSKKKGAAIMLLTKDSVDSHTIMNLPYLYNPGYYESLYIDRNITAFIDSGAIIDEDEGEVNESAAITEAIIHNQKKPGDITILYDFAPGCTPNDISIVKKFYNEARIMHWLRYFKTNHRRYPESLTIHCYTSVQALAKDCLPDALERQEIVLNSWSDEENIYVVAPRGFGAIKTAEGGNYQFYYANELITWAAMRSSPACSRQLACYVGTALSGRMTKKMMDKVDDNYGDVKDSSMAAAWAVKCLYDEEGDIAIRQLVKSGDVSILTSRVVSKYASKAWAKLKPIIREGCSEQIFLNEGYIIPGKDIESNTRMWTKGHNILYVTGLSGGGKSTIARELALEMDGIYIELDLIEHAKNFVGQDKYNRTDMALINKYWKKHNPGKDPCKMSNEEYNKYFADVWLYLLDYMKKHKDELFVVEGIQIIRIAHKISPEIIREPMIIKGTSMLQSMIRRFNRDKDAAANIGGNIHANEKGLLGNLKDFFNLVNWYYDQEYSIGFLRKAVKAVKKDEATNEAAGIPLPSETVLMEDWKQPGPQYVINEDYISDGEFITFFNGMDEQVITEAEKKYDSRLKKWLFKERLKNNKMVLMRYQELKAMNPDIKNTFLKLPLYRSKNIWIDLSYYHGLFLKNMVASKANAVNIYWDFLNRLIIEKEYSDYYNRIAIFIPCWPQAWGVDDVKKLMDYKVSLNPVSMILRMLIKNPNALKKWGNKDIVFMAPNGYFKINFETFNLRDMAKFKKLITRLAKGEVVDDDEDEDGYTDDKVETDSPAVITAKIADKIEKNMGIKLDDITGKRQKDKFGYALDRGDGQEMQALDPPASDFTHLRMRTGTIALPEKDRGGIQLEKDKKLNSGVLIMGMKDTQALDVMASDRIKFMEHQAAFYKPTK